MPETNELTAPIAPVTVPAQAERQSVTLESLLQLPDSLQRAALIESIVQSDIARRHYAQDLAYAQKIAESGQLDDLKNLSRDQAIATVMLKLMLARDWGLTRADALENIYLTNGRPAVQNELVASRLQQAGWDWDTEFQYEVQESKGGRKYNRCVGCTLWLKKWDAETRTFQPVQDRNGNQVSESFTLADAENAKVWEKGSMKPLSEKFNYQSWPRHMFYWRCVSLVKKFHAPHVLRGGMMFEERLDVVNLDDAPPNLVPAEFVDSTHPEPKPATLKDRISEQASLLGDDPQEAQE